MKGRQKQKLGNFFKIKHGYAFKGEYFSDAGPYIVLTPGNFLEEGGFKLKAKEKYYVGNFPKPFILQKGDLIVAMTEQAEGLLGSSAIIPKNNIFLHNQRIGLITELDEQQLDKKFLYYVFNTRPVRAQIRAVATGAKVRHTSPTSIYDVEFTYLSIETQRKIASILSAYDDLIENNTRRIKILEEMARMVYREWFVNFRFPGHDGRDVPVARLNAETPQRGVSTKTCLVDSTLGQIPEGWEVKTLGDLCNIVMGQSPKSEFYNENGFGLPFHQGVADYGDRYPTDRVYCTVENRIAEEGDILFSVRAPVGRLNLATKKIVIGRGICAIRRKTGNQAFVFQQLVDQFKEVDTMGGGTIFKSVTKEDVFGIKMIAPTVSLVERFETIAKPIFRELEVLTFKNQNLRQTRDLLLPKLISGEVAV